MELNFIKKKGEQQQSKSYEALMRLKGTEKHKIDGYAVKKFELKIDSENHLVELKTTYESTAESVLSKLDAMERKMTGGENYLTLYNEKKALEDKLLSTLSLIEKDSARVSASLLKRLQQKREAIERVRKNFK